MARIIGIDVPDKKRLEVALTYIYGIGRKLSNQIIAKLGLDPKESLGRLVQGMNAHNRIMPQDFKLLRTI